MFGYLAEDNCNYEKPLTHTFTNSKIPSTIRKAISKTKKKDR